MRRFLRTLVEIRRGELAITLLMSLNYYLVLVTYYFLKPARDSLFLVEIGAGQLPVVFMLIALVATPVTAFYARAGRSLRLNQLVVATTAALIANLLILRWIIGFNEPWVFYAFYVWVSIYGVLSTSQFWLLANAMFDPSQAKRLFVLFGLAGIVGAFTGGEVTGFIVETWHVSTQDLLYFCVGFLTVTAILTQVAWRLQRPDGATAPARPSAPDEATQRFGDILPTLKRSRHLRLIVGVIAMTMATASFVDFQFKAVSVEAFPVTQDLTVFLGKFYGRLSLLSFLLQLLLSYRFLRRLGVGGVLLLLPVALLGASTLMLVAPGLIAVVLLRGSDGIFKYSIDKTGRELLFLPVPLAVKKRVKVFIDIVVDRWSRGLAGALLLFCTAVLGLTVRQLSLVVVGLLAVWVAVALLIRREYVNAFRHALERRQIDPSDLRVDLTDASTIDTIRATVTGGNTRQIVYALNLLASVRDDRMVALVQPLLKHESGDVRVGAVRALQTRGGAAVHDVQPLLHDPDPRARQEAVSYLASHLDGDRRDRLTGYLRDPDPRLRAASFSYIAEHGRTGDLALVDDDVVEALVACDGPGAPAVRAQVADALGSLPSDRYRTALTRLLDDVDPGVVRRALCGIGRRLDESCIPLLIDRLVDRRFRQDARAALATFGDRIVGIARDHIGDRDVEMPVRTALCRVLSEVPTQQSVDALVSTLRRVEPQLAYTVLTALTRLRARRASLTFTHAALSEAFLEEARTYYDILQVLDTNTGRDDPADRLLTRALTEKLEEHLERMFGLLGLRYPSTDIRSAYLGVVSTRKDRRASAVEFLSNVVASDLGDYLLPIVDNLPDSEKIRRGRELFGVAVEDRTEAFRYLITGRDPWLRACGIHAATAATPPVLMGKIAAARDDPDPIVRDTARAVSPVSPTDLAHATAETA